MWTAERFKPENELEEKYGDGGGLIRGTKGA
jgi:hypothetical protein